MIKRLVFILLNLSSVVIHAQERSKIYTLEQILNLSQHSSEVMIAKQEFLSSHYEYKSVKTSNLPELSFIGTLPNFNRSISKITQPDGTEKFLSQYKANYSGGLQLSQNLPFTGGKFQINSNLERMDMFGDNAYRSFLSTPVQFAYSQPLFGFNSLKWEQKINPVKYNLSKQKYIEAIEKTSVQTVKLYFDLLTLQNRLHNAIQNKLYADTLQYFADQKYQSGKIIETEYLQIELNALQSALQIENIKNDWRNAIFRLKQFLQIKENDSWELLLPEEISSQEIVEQTAHAFALENPIYQSFQVRELESQTNLLRAKAENRLNVDIYAAFGLTQNAEKFADVYKHPMDQEIASLGLRIPILNWGKTKYRVKIAESQQEIEHILIDKEKQTFEQELSSKILQFNAQKMQVSLSKRAMEIAHKRLQVQKNSYTLGKSSFTDLSNSINDKDQSTLAYIGALNTYWTMFYEIRQITLYDFEKQAKIQVDFNNLIR